MLRQQIVKIRIYIGYVYIVKLSKTVEEQNEESVQTV